jgi:hypothetical protein
VLHLDNGEVNMAYQKGKYLGSVSAYEIEDGTLNDTLQLILGLIARYGKDAELTFNFDYAEYDLHGPKIEIREKNEYGFKLGSLSNDV